MEEHLKKFYDYLAEKKLKDIAIYDLSTAEMPFDFGIITTASSALNNKKIANILMQDFGFEKFPEGYNKGEWIVFDFNNIVLHCFTPQSRERYNLDKLWQSKKISV